MLQFELHILDILISIFKMVSSNLSLMVRLDWTLHQETERADRIRHVAAQSGGLTVEDDCKLAWPA